MLLPIRCLYRCFFYLGYDFLAFFNFFSVTAWIYARKLNQAGQLVYAISILIVEVILHAVIATIAIGSQSSFQYYLFALIPFSMFHQKLSNRGFISLAPTIIVAYLVSVFISNIIAHNVIDPLTIDIILYSNVFVVFLGLSLVSYHFRKSSLELERELFEMLKVGRDLISGLSKSKLKGTSKVYYDQGTDEQTIDRAVQTSPSGYIVKPFNRRDIDITLKIALKEDAKNATATTELTHLGSDYYYNTTTKNLFYKEIPIALTAGELKLFDLCLQHRGQIVAHEQIDALIWPDKGVSESTRRGLHFRLRTKLNNNLFETVIGIGCRIK